MTGAAQRQWQETKMSNSHNFDTFAHASEYMRKNIYHADRLTKVQSVALHAAVDKHNQRDTIKPLPRFSTLTNCMLSRMHGKWEAICAKKYQEIYRRATSSWAGGGTYIAVKIGDPFAIAETERVWSSNGKWSGNDLNVRINISKSFATDVLAHEGLLTAGGMLTTHAQKIEENLWQATWIVQSRGMSIKLENGYIKKLADNSFIHADSIKKLSIVAKKREKSIEESKKSGALKQLSSDEIMRKFGEVVVTMRDSKKAGNCDSGTQNFAERFFPGRDKATVKEILCAQAINDYMIAACRVAIVRSRKI